MKTISLHNIIIQREIENQPFFRVDSISTFSNEIKFRSFIHLLKPLI
jgi:hypothetical protein